MSRVIQLAPSPRMMPPPYVSVIRIKALESQVSLYMKCSRTEYLTLLRVFPLKLLMIQNNPKKLYLGILMRPTNNIPQISNRQSRKFNSGNCPTNDVDFSNE